ncbi:MAG: UbiH/UbiF family hydroxylase, partial [Octadecabacter sp.]
MTKTDIFISGGGVAGLTAAAAFGGAGFNVVIADPMPPVTDDKTDGADLRTTAFLQPARDFLIAAGLWDRLSPFATPLQIMRIVDAGG